MWFKEFSDQARLVDPVAEVRPLLQKHYEKMRRSLSTPVYSKLHYGYVMTLKQIAPKAKFPDQPKNLRVLESDRNGPIAIHEVSLNKNKPKLLQTFLDLKYISNFEEAILKIKSEEKDETKGEIRYLSVLALNVEAVWLHFEEDNTDKFAFTREFDAKEREVYTGHEFRLLLDRLKHSLGKITGEMGT